MRAQGPHVSAFTPDVRAALIDGLVDGNIAPGLWRRCVDAALAGLPAEPGSSLFDDVRPGHPGHVSVSVVR